MDLVAAVWKLATHDIYECPVFATATDGPTAVVYTAWGLRIPEDETKVRIEVMMSARLPDVVLIMIISTDSQ